MQNFENGNVPVLQCFLSKLQNFPLNKQAADLYLNNRQLHDKIATDTVRKHA